MFGLIEEIGTFVGTGEKNQIHNTDWQYWGHCIQAFLIFITIKYKEVVSNTLR